MVQTYLPAHQVVALVTGYGYQSEKNMTAFSRSWLRAHTWTAHSLHTPFKPSRTIGFSISPWTNFKTITCQFFQPKWCHPGGPIWINHKNWPTKMTVVSAPFGPWFDIACPRPIQIIWAIGPLDPVSWDLPWPRVHREKRQIYPWFLVSK